MSKIDGSRQIRDESITGTQVDDGSLTIVDLSDATIVTEVETIESNDNDTSLPTNAAIIDYVGLNTFWEESSGIISPKSLSYDIEIGDNKYIAATSGAGTLKIFGSSGTSTATLQLAGTTSTTDTGTLNLYGNASVATGAYNGTVNIWGSYRAKTGTSYVNIYGAQVSGAGNIYLRAAWNSVGSITNWASWSNTGDVYLYGSNTGNGDIYLRGSNTNTGRTYLHGSNSGIGTLYFYGSASNTGNTYIYGTYSGSTGNICLYGAYDIGTSNIGAVELHGNSRGIGTINIQGTGEGALCNVGTVNIYGAYGVGDDSIVNIAGRKNDGTANYVYISDNIDNPNTTIAVHKNHFEFETIAHCKIAAPNGFVGASGVVEKAVITCPAGNTYSSSGSGDYWTFQVITSTYTTSNYYVWYNVNSGNSDPSPGGIGIEVDISSSDDADDVRYRTVTVISTQCNDVNVFNTYDTGKLKLYNKRVGSVTDPTDGTAGITVTIEEQGAYESSANGTINIKGHINPDSTTSTVILGDANNSNSALTIYGTTTADNIDLRSGKVFKVNGTQVVGSQQSHIADATTSHNLNATFSDTEVETALDNLGTKINNILSVLEAHGLVASS